MKTEGAQVTLEHNSSLVFFHVLALATDTKLKERSLLTNPTGNCLSSIIMIIDYLFICLSVRESTQVGLSHISCMLDLLIFCSSPGMSD